MLALLEAILADLQKLPGAASRGRHELYDEIRGNGDQYRRQEQIRRTEAAQVCAGCPASHLDFSLCDYTDRTGRA
ncbi:MAG: hypothetical protein ACRDSH_01470 [Pseudonocardiaceae bacterium]